MAAIVAELTTGNTTLIDAKIEKIYQPDENEIRINLFARNRGRDNLIIESGKRLHMSKYLKESPKVAQSFPMLLRKYITGARIISIEQHEFDRIVKIGLVRGGEESILIAELFSKGNIILTDKDGRIILPMKPVTFRERRIRSGEIYELPKNQINPMKTSVEEMKEILSVSDRDAIRTLANQFNLGGLYSEEVFKRCSIDKTKPANELTDDDIQIIYNTINEMLDPIRNGSFSPRLILKEKKEKGKAEKESENGVEKDIEKADPSSIVSEKTGDVVDAGGAAAAVTAADAAAADAAAADAAATDAAATDADANSPAGGSSAAVNAAANAADPADNSAAPAFTLPAGMEIADVVALDLAQYKGLPFVEFKTFSEALDEAFGKTALKEVEVKKEEVKQDKKLGIYERRLKQQTETIEKFDREIEKNTKIAESIYSNYAFVESILNVLNGARDSGRSWDEIKKIIDAAKKENSNEAAKAILSIQPADASVTVDLKDFKAVLDIRKTVPQNANVYYDLAKKFEKKKDGAEKALADTQAIIEKKEKEKKEDKSKNTEFVLKRKKHWYDRFKWFISSDGFLVVGGRDSDSNEEIFKKYMEKRDFVFHTQHPGAPLTVVKSEGKEVPETTLQEAATFAVSHSTLWKGGSASGDCYMVKGDQVSKTPESGEYVPKGSFIIRGERRYFENVTLELAVGLEFRPETRAIGGPISAVTKNGDYVCEIVPGKFNQNDLSKKIYRLYTDMIKDQKFLKQIASPDLIAMVMPPGESDIRKGPEGGKAKDESMKLMENMK
ncbi:ribosome rescue protein RqcH [Methanimicrococcus hongohii]|uniref:ribosome rescue protein RqcH n=1 Tax=Methanimicrococcus hongohii TaxID=3028295 RepID=UPI0029300094|nr:ribosome rescue protein RqcH [Methanimicrococcus sp. Hf6]